MKTIGRVSLIIIAALVVIGATFAIIRYGNIQGIGFDGGRDDRLGRPEGSPFEDGEGFAPPRFRNDAPGFDPSARPEGFSGRGEGRRGGGFFGVGTVFKDLLIIGILVLAVIGLTKVYETLRHWMRRSPPPAPPPSPPPVVEA